MALTADGRSETEAHRIAQLAVGARAEIALRALWPRLDITDLDGSQAAWLRVSVATTRLFYQQSQKLAAAYVTRYRDAELDDPDGPIVRPDFNTAATREALVLAGPVRVKAAIGTGLAPEAAKDATLTKFAGIVRRFAMAGGRELVAATTGADTRAVGWRRVTDGNPCAFCAMLASRGPVYSSQQRAQGIAGSGLRYHGHCGCTAEIVYGEWKPSEAEARYIEEYQKAAAQADAAGLPRTQQNVLWRLRDNGVFRDSPLARNK